jgi:hypothetical protein
VSSQWIAQRDAQRTFLLGDDTPAHWHSVGPGYRQSTASVSPPQIKPYPYYLLTNFQLCHTFFQTATITISYSPTTHRILLRTNQSSVLLSTAVYTFIDSRDTSLNWRKLCKNISRIFLFTHTYCCSTLLIFLFLIKSVGMFTPPVPEKRRADVVFCELN